MCQGPASWAQLRTAPLNPASRRSSGLRALHSQGDEAVATSQDNSPGQHKLVTEENRLARCSHTAGPAALSSGGREVIFSGAATSQGGCQSKRAPCTPGTLPAAMAHPGH